MSIMCLMWNRWRICALLATFVVILSLANEVAPRLMAQQKQDLTATAFVVNADGYLLTAAHVIKDAAKVEVAIGGKSYDATVLSVDEKRDLALLQIEAKGLTALPLGNSNAVQVGEEVRAFGFPLASMLGESVKVTRGTLSGIETKDAQEVFQIDASVNPGNSGGPLVNEKGEVIGVVNAKLVGMAVSSIAFAVPIDYAKPLLRDEGVESATEGAREKLDGPELVRRVSPAVALVTVIPKTSALIVAPVLPGLVRMLPAEESWVYSVAFSPDGKTVASGGQDKVVKLWDVQMGTLKLILTGHKYDVNEVAFSPDGKMVASGGYQEVRLWDVSELKP